MLSNEGEKIRAQPLDAPPPGAEQGSILIIEDDPGSRAAMYAILSPGGYRIEMAENGRAGLQKAAQLLPDIILLDVMMPGMDGFEVCRRLRATPNLAEVPIVLITSLDDAASRLRGFEAGADDFLSKPTDRHELRARVRTITRLNRYRSLMDERHKLEAALSELNRQNRELERLSQRMLEVQERERRAVAVELHDEIGQNLTALKIVINQLAKPSPAQPSPKLREAQDILQKLIRRVRDLSLNLRPSMLDDFGLFAALTWLAEQVSEQTGLAIATNFSEFDEQRFPPAMETAIFRIAQEALTNVARHAQARQVVLELTATDGLLTLAITDDGIGFNAADPARRKQFSTGLSGMQERARMAGGEWHLESLPGEGCKILARFKTGEPRFQ